MEYLKNATQKDADEMQDQAERVWADMIKKSGKSQTTFIMTDERSSMFLSYWQDAKDTLENLGLEMKGPPCKVQFHD